MYTQTHYKIFPLIVCFFLLAENSKCIALTNLSSTLRLAEGKKYGRVVFCFFFYFKKKQNKPKYICKKETGGGGYFALVMGNN
jgi:hypothetical protein